MKSTSGKIYVIKGLNYAIINHKKVQVLEEVVTKPIAIAPFQRENGDKMVAGRGLMQTYRAGLDALRSAGHAILHMSWLE